MYRFKVCELIGGDVLDELPMVITSDLTQYLKMYGEGDLALPLFDGQGRPVSDTWEQSILPGRSLILVVDELDRIVWSGVPHDRQRNPEYTVKLPCRTLEAYLIDRYMPTRNYVGMDQARIFQAILETTTAGGVGLEYDCPNTGVIRDKAYNSDENARIYDRGNELSNLINGFDWTIAVEWANDAHTRVRKVVRLGYPHLGNRTNNPVHVFETGQNIETFDYREPWGKGDAATHVTAIGDGEGDSKLMSAPVIDYAREAAGWPRVEERKTFSGVTEQSTIDSHARALAAYLFGGQQILTLTARNPTGNEDFTRLGDMALGDTARAILNTPQLKLDVVWPAIGRSLTPATGVYKPILAKIGEPSAE